MPDESSTAPQSVNILLVDDSTTVRMVLAAELREAGFRVTAVPTIEAARRALKQASNREPIDLMILDLTLPDGQGIDFLQEIRHDPALLNLPVMVLSGDNQFTSRLRSLGVGADDFVGKPHSKAYLIGRARALTGARLSNGSTAPNPWRVLIVDHDSGLRQTLSRILRVGHNCDVVALENADQAAQYFGVQDARADVVVVERRCFLRVLGFVQNKYPGGLPVIVLDESGSDPRPRSSSPEGTNRLRAPLTMSKTMELHLIADAVLERLNDDECGRPRVASGSIPPAPRALPKKLAHGA